MNKVAVEVEEGSYLWAQIMLQEGKCVTSDKLTFGDEDEMELFYLKLEPDFREEKQICLYGLQEDGESIYFDWREPEDLPEDGYRIVDITKITLGFIDKQMDDLTYKMDELRARKRKLLETNS